MDARTEKNKPIKAQFKMITVCFKRAYTRIIQQQQQQQQHCRIFMDYTLIHSLTYARTTNKFRI